MTTLADVWDLIPVLPADDAIHTATCTFPPDLAEALTTAQNFYNPIYARLSVKDGACSFDLMKEMHPTTRTGLYSPELTDWMIVHGDRILVSDYVSPKA